MSNGVTRRVRIESDSALTVSLSTCVTRVARAPMCAPLPPVTIRPTRVKRRSEPQSDRGGFRAKAESAVAHRRRPYRSTSAVSTLCGVAARRHGRCVVSNTSASGRDSLEARERSFDACGGGARFLLRRAADVSVHLGSRKVLVVLVVQCLSPRVPQWEEHVDDPRRDQDHEQQVLEHYGDPRRLRAYPHRRCTARRRRPPSPAPPSSRATGRDAIRSTRWSR